MKYMKGRYRRVRSGDLLDAPLHQLRGGLFSLHFGIPPFKVNVPAEFTLDSLHDICGALRLQPSRTPAGQHPSFHGKRASPACGIGCNP